MRALLAVALWACSMCAWGATPQVAGGATHSLALSQDGKVYAWGDDFYGQLGSGRELFRPTPAPVDLAAPGNVVGLSAGSSYAMALLRDGSVLAWGNNGNGQLGDGTVTTRATPGRVTGLESIIAVDAGYFHSLAADRQGAVWAWGSNSFGKLGQGASTIKDSKTPIKVLQLDNVVDVRAGRSHSLALTRDGKVMAWGRNTDGQLGDSTVLTRRLPVSVNFPMADVQVVAIDVASNSSFALDSMGRLWSWGANDMTVLGDDSVTSASSPVYLNALEKFGKVRSFAVGSASVAAVLTDGSLWVWGSLAGYFEENATGPARVSGLPGTVAQVRLGVDNILVTLTDGRLLAYGDNANGQLGNGTVEFGYGDFAPPKGVTGPIAHFALGADYALTLDASGRLLAWGNNAVGQLGGGASSTLSVPGLVKGLGPATRIASGRDHALALLADGTVRAWGDNGLGQLGDDSFTPVSASPVVAQGLTGIRRIAAGDSSSAALDNKGQLWGWGSNLLGALALAPSEIFASVPTLASGVPALSDVSAGSNHMMGLDLQGRVWAWGYNASGQLGDNAYETMQPRMLTSLSNIAALSAGGDRSMALDTLGRVWAWGDNIYLQTSPASAQQVDAPTLVAGLPTIKAISAGPDSSLALALDGGLWAWGAGSEGQLGDGKQVVSRAQPVRVGTDTYAAIGTGGRHSLALRGDGIPWSFGLNSSGQQGDGGFISQNSPVGVIDAGLDSFFDLDTTAANQPVAADKIPPFFAVTQRLGSNRFLTLTSKLKLVSSTQALQVVGAQRLARPSYNIYVVALVPGAVTGQHDVPVTVWARGGVSNWGPYLGGPLAAYLSNVAANNDQALLIDILDSTDLSTALGTRFFLGYGTSTEEMLASGRFRMVYEVAEAASKPAM